MEKRTGYHEFHMDIADEVLADAKFRATAMGHARKELGYQVGQHLTEVIADGRAYHIRRFPSIEHYHTDRRVTTLTARVMVALVGWQAARVGEYAVVPEKWPGIYGETKYVRDEDGAVVETYVQLYGGSIWREEGSLWRRDR